MGTGVSKHGSGASNLTKIISSSISKLLKNLQTRLITGVVVDVLVVTGSVLLAAGDRVHRAGRGLRCCLGSHHQILVRSSSTETKDQISYSCAAPL